MLRRWLIRGLALTFLALCVFAWAASYWFQIRVIHRSKTESGLGISSGRLYFYHLPPPLFYLDTGWSLFSQRSPEGWFEWDTKTADAAFLGFGVLRAKDYFGITLPLWFPAFFLAFSFLFIWRLTRPKPIGRHFPVKPAPLPPQ
jgi:hypothetical protein